MNHISLEILSQYIGGKLSEKQKAEVEAHLSVCERCREEFVMAAELINDESLHEPSDIPGVRLPRVIGKARFTVLTRKARSAVTGIASCFRRTVREWQQGMAPPPWTLQTVRSETPSPESVAEQTYFLRKRMRNVDIELYAEKSDKDHMRLCVKAFQRGKPLCDVEVALQREGSGKSKKVLRDETAFFEKKRLPFGVYHLSLKYGEKALGTYTFQMDPTGIYEKKDLS